MNCSISKFLFFLILSTILACNNHTPEQLDYINTIENSRLQNDSIMQYSENSPFNYKSKVKFHGLNYFDPDPNFIFESTIKENEIKDTIIIFGTKGEERSAVRYGYLTFIKNKKEYKLNVYSNNLDDGKVYHSIWFTDKTTNNETYGVGRYLPFELNVDKNHTYTIDFNLAFNPYCAYSAEYSCAIPSKEDYLDLKITAGEKNYHD